MSQPPATTEPSSPWGRHQIPEEGRLALTVGPMDIWLEAKSGEVRMARGEVVGAAASRRGRTRPPEPPDDAEWTRWATPSGEREIVLVPAFPNRTVVLEPETPFRLLPRAEARIYVRVPLWIRLELSMNDRSETVGLEEIPTIAMSDTWWGDFLMGELAYWLPTTARREMHPDIHLTHLAACPLHLVNRSGSELGVEKLAFRVEHLSIFTDRGRLWADEARVSYQGEVEGSQIEVAGSPPEEAPDAIRVREPRVPIQRGFRARTFDRLRQLPGMGGVL